MHVSVQQRQELDPKAGLRGGGDVRAPVADLHIVHRNVEAWKEADGQSATDVDFHAEGVGGEGLHTALGIPSKNHEHDDPDEHKNSDHAADGEEDGLARDLHSASCFDPGESGSSGIIAQKVTGNLRWKRAPALRPAQAACRSLQTHGTCHR